MKIMKWQRNPILLAGVGLLVVASFLVVCGGSSGASSGGKTISVNVGLAKSIKLKTPLKVGIYTSSGSVSWGSVEDPLLTREAAAHNIKLTVYDSNFSSSLQLDQLQTAIRTKQYNVLGVLPVDGQVICSALSKEAPAANLLVVDFDQPLCGRFTNPASKLWQPGTLDYISGYNTKATLKEWIDYAANANPGAHQVALIEGVATDGLSTNSNAIVKQLEKTHPGFNVVATENTDYTTEEGYTDTLSVLQAHPNVSVIISTQSDITQGVARAVAQDGKTKSVYLADYGGQQAIVNLMKQGEVQETGPTEPAWEGNAVIKTLVNLVNGKKIPRFVGEPFQIVTPKNVASYHAQY